jgi:hypothetical protein
MIWLSSPPWGRWILVAVVALLVIYFEVRPEPTVDHPYATRTIGAGETLGRDNTEMRRVPVGLLEGIPEDSVAARTVDAGAPILPADVGPDTELVPGGWWVVTLEVPAGARAGDRVRLVVVDSGLVVDGFVASPPDPDPFSNRGGGVAIPAEHAATVAGAAADGRVVVLISTG